MTIDDFDDARKEVLRSIGVRDGQRIFLLNGYPAININRQSIRYVHRLVAAHTSGITLTRAIHVHHVDHDRMNFLPSNLKAMTHGEHNGEHRRVGPENHFFGRKHSPEARAKITEANKHRKPFKLTPEQCAKVAEAKRRQWQDPAYREKVVAAVRLGVKRRDAKKRSQHVTPTPQPA